VGAGHVPVQRKMYEYSSTAQYGRSAVGQGLTMRWGNPHAGSLGTGKSDPRSRIPRITRPPESGGT